MIQRIQTVYLALAFILTAVGLSLPIGQFGAESFGEGTLYNLWATMPDGKHDLTYAPLFATLLLTTPVVIYAIVTYKRRMLQARLCLAAILLYLIWYVLLSVFSFRIESNYGVSFSYHLQAVFPAISIILTFMARKAIIKDEKLVRAADRIR